MEETGQDIYVISEISTIGVSDITDIVTPPSCIMHCTGSNYSPLLEEVNYVTTYVYWNIWNNTVKLMVRI